VSHDLATMHHTIDELLVVAANLGSPPDIVGQAEVDQINIISRWIHRHSDDRAFFPFNHALAGEEEKQLLADHIWHEVETARTAPIKDAEDEMEDAM
jgi:DNA polymerase-3 subunit epsilon